MKTSEDFTHKALVSLAAAKSHVFEAYNALIDATLSDDNKNRNNRIQYTNAAMRVSRIHDLIMKAMNDFGRKLY